MIDSEYFSHDYHARNDKDMERLLMKLGMTGVGIFWCIVEMLYEEGGYLPMTEYERIGFVLREEQSRIVFVVEESGLFHKDKEKFWSESVLRRLQTRIEKSEKARKSVQKRWKKYERNTNVLPTNTKRNTIKGKESKVKEIVIPNGITVPDAFKAEYAKWLQWRKQNKLKPLKNASIEEQIKFLSEQPDPLECMRQSIRNGWQGLFEVKAQYRTKQPEPKQMPRN